MISPSTTLNNLLLYKILSNILNKILFRLLLLMKSKNLISKRKDRKRKKAALSSDVFQVHKKKSTIPTTMIVGTKIAVETIDLIFYCQT